MICQESLKQSKEEDLKQDEIREKDPVYKLQCVATKRLIMSYKVPNYIIMMGSGHFLIKKLEFVFLLWLKKA